MEENAQWSQTGLMLGGTACSTKRGCLFEVRKKLGLVATTQYPVVTVALAAAPSGLVRSSEGARDSGQRPQVEFSGAELDPSS